MTGIMNSNESGYNQNPYGNIQRIGSAGNGRTVYRVIDSKGLEAGRLTIPNVQQDVFESAYKDIMESAPKIQKFVAENSAPEDLKKRRTLARTIVAVGGAAGLAIPFLLTKNMSAVKRILITGAGLIAGISAGFAGSFAATVPPGSMKFAKATKTFSKLDIQPYGDSRV